MSFSSSVQFSHSVLSDTLQPNGLLHARLPCPSPIPGAYSNSCPFRWWCHPTISSCVIPFSFHIQSTPASGSFQMSQFFTSGGQSIAVSASALVLPMKIRTDLLYDGLVGSPCSPRDSQESSPTPQFKSINSRCSDFFTVQFPYPYMTTGKIIALTRRTFVGKVMSLLYIMLSKLVTTFHQGVSKV